MGLEHRDEQIGMRRFEIDLEAFFLSAGSSLWIEGVGPVLVERQTRMQAAREVAATTLQGHQHAPHVGVPHDGAPDSASPSRWSA